MTPANGDNRRRGGSPRFYELLEEMGDVHAAKNTDYSPGDDPFGNFREAEEVGVAAWIGAWIRLQDKYKRVQGLIKQYVIEGRMTPAVTSEKVDDTIIDLANYAVIVRCLYDEYKAAPIAATEQPVQQSVKVGPGLTFCDVCGDLRPDDKTDRFENKNVCYKCEELLYLRVAQRIVVGLWVAPSAEENNA